MGAASYALFEVRTGRGQIGVVIIAIFFCSTLYMALHFAGGYFCTGAHMYVYNRRSKKLDNQNQTPIKIQNCNK
jgi:hypothetical protein